jgi:tetratricopeptide (TPR) repeat protein
MRKLRHFILGLFALTAIIGCNDEEFLTEKPKTIYTIENAFDKSSQVDAQLVRAYRQFMSLYGYGFDGINNVLGGTGADYFDITNFLCGRGASGFSNYANWTTTTGWINNLWNALYQLGSYANLALMGAEEVTWDNPEDKEYAIAQAKFFRGYAYLRLAECYGGVPIVEEYSEALKLDYVRATRAQTYEFAISNLKDAVAGLPDYPLQDGRVAKGAANHFLAEAYLGLGIETGNAANYTLAITAAQATIDAHPLMTERFGTRANPADMSTMNGVRAYKEEGNVYYDLFQIGNYDYSSGNTEAVLTIQQPTYDEHQEADRRFQSLSITRYVGPVFRDMRWRADLTEQSVDACPWNGNVDITVFPGKANSAYLGGESIGRVAATRYISYKVWAGEFADDMRNDSINIAREFICINRDHSLYGQVVTGDMLIDSTRLFPMWSKTVMQDEWGWHPTEVNHRTQWGRDWYAVRSAETYLLLAEAYLRNSQPGLAADALNAVRQRAQATKMFTGAEVDIYTILDERAREVLYEEHRWPTLLRIGGDVMVNQITQNAMYVADQPYFTGTIDWELFPIPLTVIQMNTGATIDQNQGWD